MLSVLICDPAPQAIGQLLQMFGYNTAMATHRNDALQMLQATPFDLVILDRTLDTPHDATEDTWQPLFETIRSIRNNPACPAIPLVLVGETLPEQLVVGALRRGADLCLSKPLNPATFLASIEALARRATPSKTNGHAVTKTIQAPLNGHSSSVGMPEHGALVRLFTPREHELLHYLVQGYSNAKISETLCISETTVKNHLAHIFKKLKVSNRTQAAYKAQQLNLA